MAQQKTDESSDEAPELRSTTSCGKRTPGLRLRYLVGREHLNLRENNQPVCGLICADFHGGFVCFFWWCHGGVMVVSWWFHGGFMVILCSFMVVSW